MKAPNNLFKGFFEQTNVLTKEEFDSIDGLCEFDIEMPDNDNDFIHITIKAKDVLPTSVYSKLVNANNPKLKIDIQSDNLNTDYSKLGDYLSKWAKKNYPDVYTINKAFEPDNFSAKDDTLTLMYTITSEADELKKIEKELLFFLNKAHFAITKIEYKIDIKKQQVILDAAAQTEKDMAEANKIIFKEPNALDKYKTKYKPKGKIINLDDVNKDFVDKVINISGKIISKDKRDSKKTKDYVIFDFVIYNNHLGALKATFVYSHNPKNPWQKKDQMPLAYVDAFNEGQWVTATVRIESTKFSKGELEARIFTLYPIDEPEEFIPKDEATNKRVELLAHTNYTAYDGLDKAETIYDCAQKMGHKALATVDRDNVQAFPDIQNHVKNDVKQLFGVELQMIEDMIPVCVNPHGQSLEKADYVVFDIETTGLYPEYEDLIEFGAIKWEKGRVTEHLDFFVKPTKPLTNVAINMSHITEDMVKDGVSQKQALIKIKEFIGNHVLIAHNGIRFDLNFLNKLCERYGVEPINNTLIDTLEISHSINKHLARHNLGTLTRKLKIDYNELIAHRADKDAEYLLSVWQSFLKQILNMGISNVDDINSKLNNETLKSNRHGYYVDIYAKNQNGIKAIYELVSLASTKQMYLRDNTGAKLIGQPKIHPSNLEPYRKDLIVCPHPLDGEIWESALNDRQEDFENKLKKYDYVFVSPAQQYDHLVFREEITKNNVNKTLNKIISTANKLGIKPCAVSNSFYCLAYQKQFHEIYVYVPQLGNKPHWLFRYDGKIFIPDFHYLSTKEMLDSFKFIKDEQVKNDLVINNTNYFADSIEKVEPIKTLIKNKNGVPKYPYSPTIKDSEKFIREKVEENSKKIWPNGVPEDIQKRIDKEINAIFSNGYAVVYWISHLLVKKSTDEGYLVGSRGSVGSSVVAFLSNISEVNPLPPYYLCKKCHHYEPYPDVTVDGFDLPKKKCPVCGEEMYSDGHNIPFESFLGQDCDKIPDIDLNFSGEYQWKAHNFIKEMFGEDHAFRAGTISTVADKTAFGYVKKYFESTDPDNYHSEALVVALAKKCAGVKKTTGQHPGGIVVVPQNMDLEDFCPCQYPSNDRANSWKTTHFDYHQMNEVLLKFDILGHDEPTILNHLEKATGVDPRTIPYFDDKVMEMFADSKSIGILDPEYDLNKIATYGLPEFGTDNTTRIVGITKPKGFGDLVKISGLSHGTGVWQGNAEVLLKKGAKLSQVICCREDIIDFLTSCGLSFLSSFKSTESVRKSKGLPTKYEEEMQKTKVPQWYIDSLKKITYLFPKAHATAYVIDAVRTAWYKVYYPAQFYAVWLSNRMDKAFDIESISKGKEAVTAKIKDLKTRIAARDPEIKEKDEKLIPILEVCLEMFARGIKVDNINLEKSLATEFVCEGNTLIPPFVSLDGLGAEVAKSIVEARNEKPFGSLDDLSSRTKLSSTLIQKLKDMHVLDNLPEDSQMRLF